MRKGDEVKCVSNDFPCGCPVDPSQIPFLPKTGSMYIVAIDNLGICPSCWSIHPVLLAVGHVDKRKVWPQSMFRKLQHESDDEFLEAMNRAHITETTLQRYRS